MTDKKKSIVVSIMGRLVKKTTSRHYWLYNDTKWERLGLTKIANALKVSADIIKAAIFTAAKKALASVAYDEHNGIIVKFENDAKIDKVCKAANGKGRERLIYYSDVEEAVDTLTEKFKGINKEGLKVEVNSNAQSFARCYKGVPMTTTFVLLFKTGKWRLLSASRVPCSMVHFRVLHMEPGTKASILRTLEKF